MTHHVVQVDLDARSYEIHIGGGVRSDSEVLQSALAGDQAFVVSNQSVADLYLDDLRAALGQRPIDVALIPDGEGAKSLDQFGQVLGQMLAAGHDRSTTVIALGGGVVGDLAGFVAASYQRGVRFVQVPTTLLAQVDSSVGGKTAVNHPSGKNMIGAFHQPALVLADTETLGTLPEREVRAGIAEIIKYGVIADADFFCWLEDSMDALLAREPQALSWAIRRSCEIKAQVVAADEREQGIRALLNYGHTFGHAIEKVQGYGQWLHGEAVAAGMVLAAGLSVRLGRFEEAAAARVEALVCRAGLPVDVTGQDVDALLAAMGLDKKAVGGRKRFILPTTIGTAMVADDVADSDVLQALMARC